MSRTRKRNPREFYKGTEVYVVCPRHGYCSWCDRGRQHKNRTGEVYADQAVEEYYED